MREWLITIQTCDYYMEEAYRLRTFLHRLPKSQSPVDWFANLTKNLMLPMRFPLDDKYSTEQVVALVNFWGLE